MSYNNPWIFFIVLFLPYIGTAQEPEHAATTFRVFVEAGGGYAYKLTNPKIISGDYKRDGFTGTVRLKWGSSNLLGVGIESGWLPISTQSDHNAPSEFGKITIAASLSAIPVMAIFSMQRMGLQLHTGLGYYRVNAVATVMGVTMESSEWNLGYLLSLGYGRPITDDYRVGAEIKWNNIVEQQISMISIQVRVMYRLFGE